MSFQTWHDYGYGIKVSRIPNPTVEQLEQLFALAPEASAKLNEEFGKNVVKNPTVEDYLGAECFWHSGLAGILAEVIQEVEGIEMLACNDFDGTEYLLYSPKYPWHMSDKDRTLTKETLDRMFARYVSIITDEEVEVDYQASENGG